MRKVYLLTLIGLLFSSFVFGQNDRYWVGSSGGTWSSGANWSLTQGGSGGAGAPTSVQNAIFTGFSGTVSFDVSGNTINSLQVLNGSVVLSRPTSAGTFNVNDGGAAGNDFYVATGATLTLSSTLSHNFTLTLAGTNPTGLIDGTVELTNAVAGATSGSGGRIDAGTSTGNLLTVSSTGIINIRAGASNLSGNKWKFNAGSQINVYRNGAVLPDGNYDPASVTTFYGLPTGSTNAAVTLSGFPSTVGTYIHDVATQSQTLNPGFGSGSIIKGDFKILNTNGNVYRIASNASNITIQGNLILNNAASTLQLSNGSSAASVNVNGNLDILAGTVDLQGTSGAMTLKVLGNINIAGTLTETGTALTSDIQLQGTSQQTFAQSGTISNDVRFQVNNSAGVLATTNWVMPNSSASRILLTLGNINMGSNLLNIQSPSTTALSGGTLSSHIIGKVRRATNSTSTYLFPVSKSASEVASIKINPAGTTATSYEVEFFRPNAYDRFAQTDAAVKNAGDYYWDITRPSGTENADITVRYVDMASGNGNAEADLRVLHWNGSAWDNFGGSGASGEITATNVSTFSPFSLGTVGLNPLPVKLESFTGQRNGNVNALKWTTSTEQNNLGFYVERSADGRTYTSLGFIASRAQGGNSNSPIAYTFNDNNLAGDKQYYRLRQVDADGRARTSNVLLIRGVKPTGITIGGLFPNPATAKVNVMVDALVKDNVVLQVVDVTGKLVKEQRAIVGAGTNTVEVDINTLTAGAYMIRLTSKASGETSITKFVKQ